MLLDQLVSGLDIKGRSGRIDTEIKGVAVDSRKVRKGYLFVCIEGFKTDGHDYIPTAIENGAAALLVQKEIKDIPDDIAVIRIDNTRYGLAHVSDIFYGHPSGKFNLVGITGTKGKTTTTHMLKAVLEEEGKLVGLIGSVANKIGNQVIPSERTTPESLELQELFSEMVNQKVDSVVMEVSSQGLELHRVSCCDFDIGAFTNLTQDHISPHEHASMEDYFKAKLKLFGMCKKALVNADSPYGKRVIEAAKCEVLTFGIDNQADIMAKNIVTHPDSVNFDVVTPKETFSVKVPIPGLFSVYNALTAIGVAVMMGVSKECIVNGLLKVVVPGRAEVIARRDNFTVMTDYAHTPDSLKNILETVKSFAKGRTVCVFGCGGDRDHSKRPQMGEISGNIADFTVITSDNPRTETPEAIVGDIEEGIKTTHGEYIVIVDRRSAIKYAIENAQKGDVIVLAGKGDETYQIFRDKTIKFDEREVVAELLKELNI